MSKLQDMSQEQVITWVNSFPYPWKTTVANGITQFGTSMGIPMTGKMLLAADLESIKSTLGIDHMIAMAFLGQISKKKDAAFEEEAPIENQNNNNNGSELVTFKLKIQGKNTNMIKGANKTWKIQKVKYEYLRYVGSDGKAELYAAHSYKWVSPNKNDGIELKYLGKNLDDNDTLEDIGIINALHMPLITTYRVNGGAELKENEQDLYDKIRPRKLNKKLLKESGVPLSKKPCCIMGYSDADGVSRAEMPCKCSFAADTMFRYMKSLFDKNLKAVKPICPVSKGNGTYDCKGNDKQREWQWGLVFAVADLSDREIVRFTKAIENRLGSTKNCPNCGVVTERNADVRISRVNCSACTGRDWCWNCSKPWCHSGLGPICGNKGCMADRLNTLLEPDNCGTMPTPSGSWWKTNNNGKSIVQTRACPKCLCLLEFVAECKHIKCVSCPHEFCFNCCGDWKTGKCNHSNKCEYSGPQHFS